MRKRNRQRDRRDKRRRPELKCDDHEWSQWGVCVKCGFKTPTYTPNGRAPDVQTHTEVFELDSLEELEALFKRLRAVKTIAPVSLRYTVAVTARRIVIFRGNNGRVPNITERIED
jgi:hypothetical protein